ncbi:MAG TPA: response regulator transcription factor [Candidatus Sulfomarinibacteraceae bacterium]|nr:response regulator transcription factor [Candidatus Sulfomarinibacteraceae bacterium]
MGKSLILLVEGKSAGKTSLAPALTRGGFEVRVFHSDADALRWAQEHVPDLVLLDGASMSSSGIRCCRRLREQLSKTPIIHTRADGEPEDSSAGADIYLQKPYTWRKVINRVRALLPVDQFEEEIVRAGKLTFFRSKPSVNIEGRGETQLTPKQAQLLEAFLRHPNQILSRRLLMQTVWDTDYVGDTRTLDVHIRWVREAIEENPAEPRRITTVRGVGYIFRLPPAP